MRFCTAVNCMDGRVQLPVINYLKTYFNAKYVDCITEPGPVHMFNRISDLMALNSIFRRVDISVNQHGSQGLAVCAHADCAGNPIDDDKQREQLNKTVIFLKEYYPHIEVIGLWIDEHWHVQQYC